MVSAGLIEAAALLDTRFAATVEALVQAYDNALKHLPTPAGLPVVVTLSVPARAYQHRGVVLRPTASGVDIKQQLLAAMAADGIKAGSSTSYARFIDVDECRHLR